MASTWTAARSGSWSSAASNTDISPWDDGAGSNPNTGCPVAGDTVVIAAGCDVLMDVDIGAAGLANLTINGHATDPGVLYWKEGTSGTLVIASGGKIQGSSGARNGRILAGKTGIWPGASVSASLMASQYGATGVVTDGGGDTRVFTPAVAPNWDENGLAGESLTINGVTYLINSNTATAATLNAGPVVGAAVTSWVLKVRPLPVANTATINLLGTANITGAALDILLYSEEPTHRYVATYGQVFDGCICNTNNTLTGAAAVFPSNNMALALPNNTLVRVSADAGNSLPESTPQLAADTDYWVVGATGNTIKLSAVGPLGAEVDITTANGPINIHVGMYAGCGISGNTITKTAHGLANTTAVMVRGDLPTPLEADTLYYVVAAATNAFSLARFSGGAAIVLSGGGTIDVYTGSVGALATGGFNAGTNPLTTTRMNVLADITADTYWEPTASSTYPATLGRSAVALVNAALFVNTDTQRAAITALTPTSITFSTAIDSIQCPGSRVYLLSRNVAIRTTTTTITYMLDYQANVNHGSRYDCELRATTLANQTTYYGSACFVTGTGNYCSGTIAGFSNAFYIGAPVLAGVAAGNNQVFNQNSYFVLTSTGEVCGGAAGVVSCVSSTVSGTLLGCTVGVNASSRINCPGTISRCGTGISSGNGYSCTLSGTIVNCGVANGSGISHLFSGTIKNCGTGISAGAGHILTGTIDGCSIGVSATSGTRISGTIVNCGQSILGGEQILQGVSIADSVTGDLGNASKTVGRIAATTASKLWTNTSYRSAIHPMIWHLQDYNHATRSYAAGYFYAATCGGTIISAAYSAGTHGVPAVVPAVVHVVTYESASSAADAFPNWVEWTIQGVAGRMISLKFYVVSTAAPLFGGAGGMYPTLTICDPAKIYHSAGETLNTVPCVNSGTSWQALDCSYTPTVDGPLTVRFEAQATAASGTTFFFIQQQHASGGAFGGVFG